MFVQRYTMVLRIHLFLKACIYTVTKHRMSFLPVIVFLCGDLAREESFHKELLMTQRIKLSFMSSKDWTVRECTNIWCCCKILILQFGV